MNAITSHLNEIAAVGFSMFSRDMPILCKAMEMDFSITNQDLEQIEFDLQGIPFALTWGEAMRQSIGREIPIVKYQLVVFHQTMGGRWHPPEWVDTLICENQNLTILMQEAILTVVKNELRHNLENIAFSQMEPINEEM